MGNPAEETYCYPNTYIVKEASPFCQLPNITGFASKSEGSPRARRPELDGTSGFSISIHELLPAVNWSNSSFNFWMLGGLPTNASTFGISSPSSFIMDPQPVIIMTGVLGESPLMARTT